MAMQRFYWDRQHESPLDTPNEEAERPDSVAWEINNAQQAAIEDAKAYLTTARGIRTIDVAINVMTRGWEGRPENAAYELQALHVNAYNNNPARVSFVETLKFRSKWGQEVFEINVRDTTPCHDTFQLVVNPALTEPEDLKQAQMLIETLETYYPDPLAACLAGTNPKSDLNALLGTATLNQSNSESVDLLALQVANMPTFDAWKIKYQPKLTGNPHEDEDAIGFVPSGDDFDKVMAAYQEDPLTVWSNVPNESGELNVISGMHVDKAEAYYITEVPAERPDMRIGTVERVLDAEHDMTR